MYSDICNKNTDIQNEETMKRISWIMLGYTLFLEYMEIENTNDMVKTFREALINKFCNTTISTKNENITVKVQVDNFCTKIHEIYQDRANNKFLLPYENANKDQNCLGWYGPVSPSNKENMLVLDSINFIDKYNSYVCQDEYIDLTIDTLNSELKKIGNPDGSGKSLVKYNTQHKYTSLKTSEYSIQIRIDELAKYITHLKTS